MSTHSDEALVLKEFGDRQLGAGNGRVGSGLSDQVMQIIRRQPSVARICDLGCGNGHLASRLGAAGYSVVGVDASERLLSIARSYYRSERVDFQQGQFGADSATQLKAQGPFDLAVSVDVVEHLYRPSSLVETAAAVLKPGDRFIICTPYHGYLKNLAIAILGRWDDHHGTHFDGGHIKFFSVATLKTLLRPAFDVEHVEFYGRVPGLWKNMICVARKRAE